MLSLEFICYRINLFVSVAFFAVMYPVSCAPQPFHARACFSKSCQTDGSTCSRTVDLYSGICVL